MRIVITIILVLLIRLLIDMLKKQLTTPSEGTDFDYGHDYGIQRAIYLAEDLDEQQAPINESEKPVVPQFVADFYESIKDDFENKVYELCLQYKHRGDELPQGVAWWFGDSRNKPIETLVKMHKFGYEVEKEKLYEVFLKRNGAQLGVCVPHGEDKTQFTKAELQEYDFDNLDVYEVEEVEE